MQRFFCHPGRQLVACAGWVVFMPQLFALVSALPEGTSMWAAGSVALSMGIWTTVGFVWMVAAGLLVIPFFFLWIVVDVANAMRAAATFHSGS